MKHDFTYLLGASAIALLTLGGSASAQDCPHGDLDARYCDVDGDLVADIPTDASQLLDPNPLIFAYTPVEDPAVYKTAWAGFLDYLAEKTGKDIVFFPVQSNAAQIEAMRSGRLHISGFNTGSNPLAVNCAGFRPFTIMASKDGHFGYEMEIITYPGSGIETVEDIKGGQLAFSSPTSNSGFKAPSAILKGDYDMLADRDFEPVFSGKHDNTILGVANKDYMAGAVANSVMQRMIERDVIKPEQVVSIYKSQTFPTTGFGVVYNLKPELQEQIRDAFFTFNWEGSGLQEEFSKSGEEQFIEMNYKDFWDVIRKIDAANGVSYACE
jgi:phosphonate transport system substrate-binding protein